MLGGEHRLNQLRDHARELSKQLDLQREFGRLDHIIGALLGTETARHLTAKQALARASGRPCDPSRLELFDALLAMLTREPMPDVPDPVSTPGALESFAFFEAYFSNYIEGTTFTVEEAEEIVFQGHIIPNRTEDSHDILGTFQAASSSPWRNKPPQRSEHFLQWLRSVNALVMQAHAGKIPGEWKVKPDQAGNTYFVMPELVPATLREGFERISALQHPLAKALMTCSW